jgi:hypothetical protein
VVRGPFRGAKRRPITFSVSTPNIQQAEEVTGSEMAPPVAILYGIGIMFVGGLSMIIALLFSMKVRRRHATTQDPRLHPAQRWSQAATPKTPSNPNPNPPSPSAAR